MKTKNELLASNARLETENMVLVCALNDILNGDVKWFGHSRAFSIGITRPSGAYGGIAVVRQCGNARASCFESYARSEIEHIGYCITGENTDHNRELLQRRAAIEAAQSYVAEAQRSA